MIPGLFGNLSIPPSPQILKLSPAPAPSSRKIPPSTTVKPGMNTPSFNKPALGLTAVAGTAAALFFFTQPRNAMGDRFTPIKNRLTPILQTELKARNLTLGAPLFIRIFKESNELEVWIEQPDSKTFALFKSYKICTWSGTLGPKQKAGDLQAPEGFYFVNAGRMNPHSRFHLSFNLGYPNAFDRAHHRTGSALMVHGNCVSIGCYAMTDPRIEEIYTLADAALTKGQPFFRVHCFPFKMTEERLHQAAQSPTEKPWLPFWQNLKEGYDFFETHKTPPNTTVQNAQYIFSP
jgi:murein L,D-transpeptidase YafK